MNMSEIQSELDKEANKERARLHYARYGIRTLLSHRGVRHVFMSKKYRGGIQEIVDFYLPDSKVAIVLDRLNDFPSDQFRAAYSKINLIHFESLQAIELLAVGELGDAVGIG